MLRLCIVTMVFFAALSMSNVQPAEALLAVGDGWEGNSWAQRFQEDGVGPYDFVRVDWISGSQFEVPVLRNFSNGGWVDGWSGLTSGSAQGPAATWSQFDVNFLGAKSTPLAFYFTAYNGTTLKESVKAVWNGSGWAITGSGWNPGTASPIPEPATLVLLGTALGMTGILGRRRRKS